MPAVLQPNAAIVANLRRKTVGDEDIASAKGHAAGTLFVTPDGSVLLLHRSPNEKNFAGHWSLPGGGVEDGETPEAGAEREAMEEMGPDVPRGRRKLIDQKVTPTGMVFHTFAQPVDEKFTPQLNGEHVGFTWSPMNALPGPMHPAVQDTLTNRVGVAADMSPEDWEGMVGGLLKFLAEEAQEPEHAEDAEFNESDHPRAPDGKFGSGGGSAETKSKENGSEKQADRPSPKLRTKFWGGEGGREYTHTAVEFREVPYQHDPSGKGQGKFGIDPDGTAFWEGPSFPLERQLVRGLQDYLNPLPEGVFIRTTWNKADYEHLQKGDHLGSMNHATGEAEAGLSVAKRPEIPQNYAYFVTGKQIGTGADGEPILETSTAKPKGKLMSYKAMSKKFEDAKTKKIDELGLTPEQAKALQTRMVPMKPDQYKKWSEGTEILEPATKHAEDAALAQEPEHAEDKSGEFEHEIALQTRGDFNWKGLLHHMHSLGSMGASRDIIAMDSDDTPIKFNWDGDGTDKIVNATIDGEDILTRKALAQAEEVQGDAALALDRESVRTKDVDGRLHVADVPLCRTSVDKYKGSEIPGYAKLGLSKDKLYEVYRPEDELIKALPTINGIPVLRNHVPTSAEDHKFKETIGATGTNARWEAPFIRGELVIWPAVDIKGIENKDKFSLSPGYRYTPLLEDGDFNGQHFEIRMVDISFNHIACVEHGRQAEVAIDSADEIYWKRIEQAIVTIGKNDKVTREDAGEGRGA